MNKSWGVHYPQQLQLTSTPTTTGPCQYCLVSSSNRVRQAFNYQLSGRWPSLIDCVCPPATQTWQPIVFVPVLTAGGQASKSHRPKQHVTRETTADPSDRLFFLLHVHPLSKLPRQKFVSIYIKSILLSQWLIERKGRAGEPSPRLLWPPFRPPLLSSPFS